MKITTPILLAALCLSTFALRAQDGPKADTSPKESRGDRTRNPEEFRQRMNERLKASLKVTDEEWTAIQPLIENVQNKLRDSMASRWGGRGRGGDGGDQPTRPGATESEALRTAVENESTSADDLKAKLEAVREQRKKSAAELATARENLRKVLTVRQEAALVAAGILE